MSKFATAAVSDAGSTTSAWGTFHSHFEKDLIGITGSIRETFLSVGESFEMERFGLFGYVVDGGSQNDAWCDVWFMVSWSIIESESRNKVFHHQIFAVTCLRPNLQVFTDYVYEYWRQATMQKQADAVRQQPNDTAL